MVCNRSTFGKVVDGWSCKPFGKTNKCKSKVKHHLGTHIFMVFLTSVVCVENPARQELLLTTISLKHTGTTGIICSLLFAGKIKVVLKKTDCFVRSAVYFHPKSFNLKCFVKSCTPQTKFNQGGNIFRLSSLYCI